MKLGLQTGENVRHRARPEWGIGEITAVNTSGTIRVNFDGQSTLSIAKGAKYLVKVDAQGHEL